MSYTNLSTTAIAAVEKLSYLVSPRFLGEVSCGTHSYGRAGSSVFMV